MTEREAVEVAVRYIENESIHYAIADHEMCVYLDIASRPEMNATCGAWLIHFPRRLPAGVESQEPSTVGVLVDENTREAKIVRLL